MAKGKCEYLYIGGMRVPMDNVLVTVINKDGTVNKYSVKPVSPGAERGFPPIKTIAQLKSLPKNSSIVATIYDPQTGNEIGEPFAFDPANALGTEGRKLAAKGYIKEWGQFADNEFVADLLAKGVSYGTSKGLRKINTAQLAWLAGTPVGTKTIKNILESTDSLLTDVKLTLAGALYEAYGFEYVHPRDDRFEKLSPEITTSLIMLRPLAVILGFAPPSPDGLRVPPEALERLYNTLAQVSASSGSALIRVAMRTIEALQNNPLLPDAVYEKTAQSLDGLSDALKAALANERVAEDTRAREEQFETWRRSYEEHADAARTGLRSLRAGQIDRATRFLHGETLVSAIAHSEDPDEIRELAEYADDYGQRALEHAQRMLQRAAHISEIELAGKSYPDHSTATQQNDRDRQDRAKNVKDVADALRMNPVTPLEFGPDAPYKIGDVGPAGSIIFSIKSGTYLEVAPQDIGQFSWKEAMAAAQNYKHNGFSDWRLPSKDELNQLFLKKATVGGFSPDLYWSSSEFDVTHAWFQYFSDGNQSTNFKSNPLEVRPVRAFSI